MDDKERNARRLAEVEAEEAAGRRRFIMDEYEFSNPEFEAYYSEIDEPGVLAVQPWLSAEVKRARSWRHAATTCGRRAS